MTTYHCPACGLYWTPNKTWTPATEGRVYNGGDRRCPDCRAATYQVDHLIPLELDDNH